MSITQIIPIQPSPPPKAEPDSLKRERRAETYLRQAAHYAAMAAMLAGRAECPVSERACAAALGDLHHALNQTEARRQRLEQRHREGRI